MVCRLVVCAPDCKSGDSGPGRGGGGTCACLPLCRHSTECPLAVQLSRSRWKARLNHDTTSLPLYAGVKQVVDLCAAPGSWSQVLSKRLRFVQSDCSIWSHE